MEIKESWKITCYILKDGTHGIMWLFFIFISLPKTYTSVRSALMYKVHQNAWCSTAVGCDVMCVMWEYIYYSTAWRIALWLSFVKWMGNDATLAWAVIHLWLRFCHLNTTPRKGTTSTPSVPVTSFRFNFNGWMIPLCSESPPWSLLFSCNSMNVFFILYPGNLTMNMLFKINVVLLICLYNYN